MVNGMSIAVQSKIRCRQIGEQDIDAVVDLLMRGFPGRARHHWMRGFERQAVRPVPPPCPRYGFLLESDGVPVGVILLLCTSFDAGSEPMTRCNLSSWYVEPAFRVHASLLIAFALKHKHVTYMNTSPARHTWPTVEAQGFTRYCSGQFFAVPALSKAVEKVTVTEIKPDDALDWHPRLPERDLLLAHARYGCLSLVCATAENSHPFIFLPFRIRKGRVPLPCMHLIYCREVADFVRFARPLGRFLLQRKMPWVILDANGPIEGLVGIYREGRGRKYFKGPNQPRLGDLAFTELVLFGP